VTAHALRKTYFTYLHEAGAPPRWVADQGGHSDPSTSLRIYTESLRGRERSHHGEAFDDLLNGDHDRATEPTKPRPSS
jgi:integrase